jgi:hypothetical protein
MKRTLLIILVISSFMLILFCAKYEGNPVGANLFDRDNWGTQRVETFYPATNDTFYQTSVANGTSVYLYSGEKDDIQTYPLIHFSTDLADTAIIEEATFGILISDIYGSTGGIFQLSLHSVPEDWDEEEITWNDFDQNRIGQAITNVNLSTETDTIFISLPIDSVQSWINASTDTLNQSLLLKVNNPSLILKFYSRETVALMSPELVFKIRDDTTITTKTVSPSRDACIASTNYSATSDWLAIGNGTALRTLLYFDLDSIPSDATINKATMTMYSDTLQAFPNHEDFFEFYAYAPTDITWPVPDVPYDSTRYLTGSLQGDSAVIYLTNFIQEMNYGIIDNFGFLLNGIKETTDIKQRIFYSTKADSAKMPRLKIYYSLPPSSRL